MINELDWLIMRSTGASPVGAGGRGGMLATLGGVLDGA